MLSDQPIPAKATGFVKNPLNTRGHMVNAEVTVNSTSGTQILIKKQRKYGSWEDPHTMLLTMPHEQALQLACELIGTLRATLLIETLESPVAAGILLNRLSDYLKNL
jgi:hypothetical protein